ncbi:NAD(P)-dependent alcohol dehydrogenase [Flagellimonas allohymeniacidonis]|uniref:NAD(P)-dependent alcohol dehydrogenase n=1 Tax=Flagellimonas allohymeniacidonis TaxID=2517819 RepID=A0A4Q8QGH5_9FLAO|nr:NAD(P)-dependent alcohol dehydrogenase [Allomuricauda hymeniacidonis]TAI49004.1 NAD(P)-dependent alcohol dehydrogenase [Allomuricauda hymeniacidonis]
MKAIVCTKYGGPEVLKLQEIDTPMPKDNEILVKVHAATVTTAGLIGRKGEPIFTRLFSGLFRPKNNILGMELAGEIEVMGKNVSSFKIGQKVFGLTGITLGANAEYISLPEDAAVITKPNNMDYEESVALIEGGLTAFNFLKNKAKIQRGQRVLIYGASGSVGTASIQLAKYYGAEVIGVCSASNLALVKSLGADRVIDYTKEDFTQNGETYDIIFDTVGKRSFLDCKNSLELDGIYLDTTGLSTVLHMIWTSLFSKKKASFAATYMRTAKVLKQDLASLKILIEKGAIQYVIDRRYPLEETAEAHRYVETGKKKGNVVIAIDHNLQTEP